MVYVIHTTSIKLNSLTVPTLEVMKSFPQSTLASGKWSWDLHSMLFPLGHAAFCPKLPCIGAVGQAPIQSDVAAAVKGKGRKQSQAAQHEEW